MPVIHFTELGKVLGIQCLHTLVYIGKNQNELIFKADFKFALKNKRTGISLLGWESNQHSIQVSITY